MVYNDPALTARLAAALKAGLGEKTVVEMPAKMTSEDFAQYWIIGKVPSALLHIGAVNAAKFAEIQRPAIPGPRRIRPSGLRIASRRSRARFARKSPNCWSC